MGLSGRNSLAAWKAARARAAPPPCPCRAMPHRRPSQAQTAINQLSAAVQRGDLDSSGIPAQTMRVGLCPSSGAQGSQEVWGRSRAL